MSERKLASRVNSVSADPLVCFFIVTVLVVYERDEQPKQRTMNVMMEAQNPNLDKSALAQIQQAAMSRIHAENNVTPDQVKDVVIMNISLLGQMTQEQFHGTTPNAKTVAALQASRNGEVTRADGELSDLLRS